MFLYLKEINASLQTTFKYQFLGPKIILNKKNNSKNVTKH